MIQFVIRINHDVYRLAVEAMVKDHPRKAVKMAQQRKWR